jgi:hypothetical protein
MAPRGRHKFAGTREGGGSTANGGAVDESQDFCAFVGIVNRQALPIAALPQIGEKAGAILMEMQKSLTLPIEDPGPPFDEGRSGPEAFQQIAQSIECACASVLHCPVSPTGKSLVLRGRPRMIKILDELATGFYPLPAPAGGAEHDGGLATNIRSPEKPCAFAG